MDKSVHIFSFTFELKKDSYYDFLSCKINITMFTIETSH